MLLEVETDPDAVLSDFVAGGLASSDPFIGMGKVSVIGRDRRRVAHTTYAGKIWRMSAMVEWNPLNEDFKVEIILDNNTKTVHKTFTSFWSLPERELGRAWEALKACLDEFKVLADTFVMHGWYDAVGQEQLRQAGDAILLKLDDTFVQFDTAKI